jgi:RNA polymerase sigma-70 factor (ECF subfamily)
LSGAGGVVSLVIHESGLSEDAAAQLNQQPDPGPTPEEEVFRKADINRVRAAIEAIPEPFREAIVLRDLEDLSYAEIAEVTGVPVGTVMSRLSRGRAMLAKELLPSSEANGEQSRSVK